MVQAHAMAAQIETTRTTVDIDAAVRVQTGAFSYAEAASALIRLGYGFDDGPRLAYRFTRGTEIIDLMSADHQRPAARYARRPVMQMAGGLQALSRTQVLNFTQRDASVAIPIPTLHGALILKSAAHMVDSRDRARHLLDAITLLACITDAGPILDALRGSDRKRLAQIVRAFDEQPLVAAQAPSDTLRLAIRTIEDFRPHLR